MPDPSETLKTAKAALAEGNPGRALALLSSIKKEAAADYALCAKISKVSDRALAAESAMPRLKIALLSSSTLAFLEPLVRYFCAAAGFNAEVKSGEFGAWKGEIADKNSWLYAFSPDIAIIATNWRDASLPAFSPDPEAAAEKTASEFASFWAAFKSSSRATLIQQAFDAPEADAAGFLSQTVPGSRAQVLKRANTRLLEKAQKLGTLVLDTMELRAKVGAGKWEDERMWLSARQHPAFAALPALAAEYARAVSAATRAPKKVCVLDLDNTLWGGIIGEDGIGAIKLGAPDPEGEAYAAFQSYLLELKERGILLAACSKNNRHDAMLPFEKHPDMRLKLRDFAAFKANWNPKSQNILEIAKELNLGTDSFVFVDDNPAEIAQVNSALPEVRTLLLPKDPSEFVKALDSQNFFDAVSLSDDDIRRNETYAENAKREALKSASQNPEDFLAKLSMTSSPAEISDTNLARAAQLAAKTNQFNLTTRRHNADTIREMAARHNAYAKTFNLKDTFGDMGVVALVIALPQNPQTLEIDTFLLSCRALGRTLEHFAIADLVDFAKTKGFKHIRGIYEPTQKNSQTKDLFAKFGFQKESESPNGASSWILNLNSATPPQSLISKIPL